VSNVINLNKFRKKKKLEDAEFRANENRAKHGRTKGQRKREDSDASKASRHLNSHKLDDDKN